MKRARKNDKERYEKELVEKEQDAAERIRAQDEGYESYIRKQLDRLDTMLEEKKALSTKCAMLSNQMNELEAQVEVSMEQNRKQWEHKVHLLHESYTTQKKLQWKEEWEASAKKKNHKLLAKSLQEQITLHLEKQKADLLQVRLACDAEKKQMETALQRLHQDEIQQERLIYTTRLEKQERDLEQKYQNQIQAIQTEHRHQLKDQQLRYEKDNERAHSLLLTELKRTKDEHSEEHSLLKTRHVHELEDVKHRLSMEKDALLSKHERILEKYQEEHNVQSKQWIASTKASLEKEYDVQHEQFKLHVIAERNEEIESIRQKLEQRYRQKAKEDIARAESKGHQQLVIMEQRIHKAEQAEDAYQQKYNDLRDKIEHQVSQSERDRHALQVRFEKFR